MDLAKYAALFVSESREHLQSCNQLLLAWERDPEATAPVDGLFRAVHSLKGMAATMGFAPLAELAHRAENLLDAVRGGRAGGEAGALRAAVPLGGRARGWRRTGHDREGTSAPRRPRW